MRARLSQIYKRNDVEVNRRSTEAALDKTRIRLTEVRKLTYVVEKPVAYTTDPHMIGFEVKGDDEEIKMARKGDVIVANKVVKNGCWIEVDADEDGKKWYLPIKSKLTDADCLIPLVVYEMDQTIANLKDFHGIVQGHLQNRRYPCSKCSKGKWEKEYKSSEDVANGSGSPRDICKRCHGKNFTRCNLSQRSKAKRIMEKNEPEVWKRLVRQYSMGSLLGEHAVRRLTSLTALRPSELVLSRYRLMNRPKSHIVVLEDLLEKINAAKLAASHGA